MSALVKAQLVLPKDLLEEVKKVAGKRKSSQFIAEATREKLSHIQFKKVLQEAAGSWRDENHPELKTLNQLRKYVRALRSGATTRLAQLKKYREG